MPVKGVDQVARMLAAIAGAITPAKQRQNRKRALRPTVAAAKRIVQKKSGKLAASLGVAEKDRNTTAVGPIKGRKHATVGHLVEFGTAPHWQPNRFGGIMHPGARPYPFMRPAHDETKDQVIETFAKDTIAEVRRAAERGR